MLPLLGNIRDALDADHAFPVETHDGVVGLLIGNHVVTSMAEKSGRRSRQRWRFTPSAAKSLAIQGTIWIIFTSIAIPGIDNWAHLGGVAVGLVIGGAIAWGRTEPATAHA